ncbi:von Willebrand factor type A domain-containing protein [Flavobacterium psychrophilum]|uniref:YfbK domain-containing protein n=1 Tax=Flavobacterium psychrophilum TaxID=96345 RepID=UPI000B7C5408|nr:von Willebrand factor type A domain-containing protein [Flavobacterium psychrophilum]EKT4499309.1 von Willebrand factor type A domain-containing protein [Flavobacterium psychrophilum]ELM3649681.1 von Willebrand factor type A domain-containing protein [Flavobacterium psychrophilum]ELM3670997.1 von Willebrand factor type A domain-containing protein [Flavobacterium psychrophilum]ELM3725511.1 von Willebrand factor type A domain-containing protein [Flavobacterium psychrophilum]ELY1992792.1 von W
MKSLKIISASIMMLMSTLFFGQDKTITGIVTDASGPMPGVNVMVKETKKGTSTDFAGSYKIQANVGQTLVYSFLGMNDEVRVIGTSTVINVSMKDNNQKLVEVVVMSLGISSKKSQKPLAKQKIKNTNQKKVNSNVTNFVDEIIIKAKKKYNINNEPIFYLNGYNVSRAQLSLQEFKNFEDIEVIKIDEAKKAFGKNGKNGIILIKTKNRTNDEYEKIEKFEEKLHKKDIDYYSIGFDDLQENYDNFLENPFESPKTAPLSTFSIDVDNASYTNIRRLINNGQKVPKDAVRVEEMINFFKYQYPQPKDNHPFSITTQYSECPWNSKHKLVQIGLQGKNIPTNDLPASNLVFLIDVSGSMNADNKLPLLIESLKILVEQLRKQDKVAIVVYAGAAGLVLPPTAGNEKQTIINALEKLNAGGSTAGGAGIELAYKTAQENFIKDGNNRVILATDGDFNVGSTSDSAMQTLIEDKRESGVFLTCLGYGMGNYKDSKMEILADKGNGNYAYIDNIQEANRFLGKEFKGSMFAIAKDVKIQIEFNPKHVQSYRLIGYENRKLRPEDFKNDAIDAGELGSNHTVTALYEIIPIGTNSDFYNQTSDLKYTKTEVTDNNYNDELATIKFRYKKPDAQKSIEMVQIIENKSTVLENATNDLKFATAVAWFGLKLRDSKLIANKSSEDIKKLARLGLSNDLDGYKAEFIRLVEAVK